MRLLALAALMLLASCGEDLVCDLSAGSGADGCPESVSPRQVYLDFGDVPVRAERSKTFEVSARQPTRIELGAPGAPFTIEPLAATADRGRPATFTGRFAPTDAGPFEATMRNRGSASFEAIMRGAGVP